MKMNQFILKAITFYDPLYEIYIINKKFRIFYHKIVNSIIIQIARKTMYITKRIEP